MENNNNINDLLEEGKKHLSELQVQLEKLAETAAKVISVAGDEAGKHAEGVINEAKINMEAAKTVIEDKTKEAMASEEYKKMEAEGKKAIEDAQARIQEISTRANEIANEVGERLKNIFGAK